MKHDKYAKKESEIESQYKWLSDVEKKMSSLVEKWELALITNNQIKEQVLTPMSTTSKYYEPMINATNWFAAKDIQLKWNKEAAKKGIPLNEVPKIRGIWAERWKHLGQGEFTTNLKLFHLPTHPSSLSPHHHHQHQVRYPYLCTEQALAISFRPYVVWRQ